MAFCTKLHHTVWVPGLSSIIYFTWANQARNVFPASFHLQTHLLHVFVTTADPAQLQTQISIALGWLKVLCPYNWQSSKLCRNDPMFALMEKGWILSTWTLYLWMKVTITEKKKSHSHIMELHAACLCIPGIWPGLELENKRRPTLCKSQKVLLEIWW